MSFERAYLGWSDGRVLVGEGPFTALPEPPEAGVAFYRNDFGLGNPTPWLVPSNWSWMERGELGEERGVSVDWQSLEASEFAGVFQEISDSIRKGTFEKTVPVVVERGCVSEGGADDLFASGDCPEPLVPYGYRDESGGFAGQSPEYLLRVSGTKVLTMALAGTARAEEREVLEVDEKEIREHEIVAQALVSKLGDLGELRRGPRGIMGLGSIVHFHTPIEVEMEQPVGFASLVRRLHPTPALGPLPRTEETMSRLIDWRKRLGTPAEFGAPFGAVVDGQFQAIVAIRGIWWKGGDVRLPAGCGVIEASRLVNEWRELRLKREAVKARFGV
ncbi:chorismate-binding protein [Haloferula sp.]|uniref:chorismate-binding protein n=1 Tax=Haloferula sp. TaxID=2497595 RepID=UPI00329E5985